MSISPSKAPTSEPSLSPVDAAKSGKSKPTKSSASKSSKVGPHHTSKSSKAAEPGMSLSDIEVDDLQESNEQQCACSPLTFAFRLALSASCPPLPPPFPPNDTFGAGVKDYTCSIGPEPLPSGVGEVDVDPATDVAPVSIYSIQFLEVDPQFNVINQDSSYVLGIDFENGAVFNYTSILAKPLAQTMGVVPGGMNMVLRGVTAAGEPVRNVFTITYTNDCGIQTFEEGDAIGWVVFVSYMSFLC